MADDYEAVHAKYAPQISLLARRQHVPGLEPDDVASEMTITLWRAYTTFSNDSQTSFGSYWWTLWLNRRSDIAQSYYAGKRVRAVPMSQVPERSYTDPLPLDPPTKDPVGAMVWRLLAEGESGKDVRMLTEISRRSYHRLLGGWRTEDVRRSLLDG